MPRFIARTEVDSHTSKTKASKDSCARRRALDEWEGGEIIMTFAQWTAYFRARFNVEEGQTMAEYGVVLAVICALTVGAFTLLRGGITGAIQSVLDALPG